MRRTVTPDSFLHQKVYILQCMHACQELKVQIANMLKGFIWLYLDSIFDWGTKHWGIVVDRYFSQNSAFNKRVIKILTASCLLPFICIVLYGAVFNGRYFFGVHVQFLKAFRLYLRFIKHSFLPLITVSFPVLFLPCMIFQLLFLSNFL